MSFETYGGAPKQDAPEGNKEMNDLMLELINFMGWAMGRGPGNNGGWPNGLRCIRGPLR